MTRTTAPRVARTTPRAHPSVVSIISTISIIAIAPAALSACGGGTASTGAPTYVTSAQTPAPAPAATVDPETRIAQIAADRDRANQRANEERAVAAAARERSDKAVHALVTRDDFEDAMWSKIERIDRRMKNLRIEASRANFDDARRIRTMLEPIAERRNSLEREIHRVHGIAAGSWDAYTREVESALNSLSRDLEAIEQPKP